MSTTDKKTHSKFSASGAKRWSECPGSVNLSTDLPSQDTPWSIEGTTAHEVLESYFKKLPPRVIKGATEEMFHHGDAAHAFISEIFNDMGSATDLLIEEKVSLKHIDPEMAGTLDAAVAQHFGELHIIDYKYGRSPVSPRENLQLIFYALGVAHQFDYNFRDVHLWIIQPRIGQGPTRWSMSIHELIAYESKFKFSIEQTYNMPNKYVEGEWCHFCPARKICPMKMEKTKIINQKQIDKIVKIPFTN